jgi:hypothetical protein
MTTKTKWILRICGIIVITFIITMWSRDYRSFHEAMEIETPEVGDEVRG